MKNVILKYSIRPLIIGLLGMVLFFPYKFHNGQTCIIDRWLNHPIQHETTISFETRLHRYVLPYGLLWWSSIGLVVVELLRTRYPRNRFLKHTNEDESL